MTRPLLILDVDGVLNPAPFSVDDSPDWRFEEVRAQGLLLHLSREMGAALLGLRMETWWLSTWMFDDDGCNECIGPALGWPKLPLVSLPPPQVSRELKAQATTGLLAEPGPPVVWVDDEADTWRPFDPHRRLTKVVPECWVGITAAHVEQIRAAGFR